MGDVCDDWPIIGIASLAVYLIGIVVATFSDT